MEILFGPLFHSYGYFSDRAKWKSSQLLQFCAYFCRNLSSISPFIAETKAQTIQYIFATYPNQKVGSIGKRKHFDNSIFRISFSYLCKPVTPVKRKSTLNEMTPTGLPAMMFPFLPETHNSDEWSQFNLLSTWQRYARQTIMSCIGIAWFCTVLHAWCCMVLHGIAWYCLVFLGSALYCIVLPSIAWYCMVLHHWCLAPLM